MTSPPVAVVHLVRRGNPAEVFARFIESYRVHRSGVEHELLILMKGYAADERAVISARMADLPCRVIELPDAGFDIGSYLECARRFRHHYFMFMNSFSVLAADDWLKKLLEPLLGGTFGATGATASWESHYTNVASRPPAGYGIGRWVRWHARRLRMRRRYPPFPNPHLRTNAFMISRDLFLRLKAPTFVDKQEAHAFESGRFGMTRQIAALGSEVCVVDASGAAHRAPAWPVSGTFWSGAQDRLLVEDNQTRRYMAADDDERIRLARVAWGDDAASRVSHPISSE